MEGYFQHIVIIIAIIVLIAALTFIGYSLYTTQHDKNFPPVSSVCPDYWVAKDNKCYNTKHLGNCNKSDSKDFDTPYFKGNDGLCKKKNGQQPVI